MTTDVATLNALKANFKRFFQSSSAPLFYAFPIQLICLKISYHLFLANLTNASWSNKHIHFYKYCLVKPIGIFSSAHFFSCATTSVFLPANRAFKLWAEMNRVKRLAGESIRKRALFCEFATKSSWLLAPFVGHNHLLLTYACQPTYCLVFIKKKTNHEWSIRPRCRWFYCFRSFLEPAKKKRAIDELLRCKTSRFLS